MKKSSIYLLSMLMLLPLMGACRSPDVSTNNDNSVNSSPVAEDVAITDEDFLAAGYLFGKPKMMKDKGIGDEVSLRGTNIGSLFVQENWMTLTSSPCQIETINVLTERFGRDKAYELLSIYEDNFWTIEDFDKCAEMGMNCIRLPITYMNVWDTDFATIASKDLTATQVKNLKLIVREDSLQKIDWFIEEAGKRGIYIILDLHGAPGSQNSQDHSGDAGRGDRLWYGDGLGDALQELTIDLWELLANRYKDNPVIAAYDILNEPAGSVTGNVTKDLQFRFFDKVYKAIRAIDPDHTIVMESCWDAQDLPKPERFGWENVMYQYHQYTWNDYNSVEVQFGEMQRKIDRIVQANFGVPILMGEFTMHYKLEAWRKCFAYLNANDIHWTQWSYKVKGNSTWGIFNIFNTYDVNIYNDSYDAIKVKWTNQRVSIQPNTVVYPAVLEYLGGKTTV